MRRTQVLLARTTARSRSTRRAAAGSASTGPSPTPSSLLAGTAAEERANMCGDLQQVLGGAVPRRYGEPPSAAATPAAARAPEPSGSAGAEAGGASRGVLDDGANWYTCIAPSPLLDKLSRLRKGVGPSSSSNSNIAGVLP